MSLVNSFDWRAAVDEARKVLVDKGFPIPKKPDIALSEMVYPTDIAGVNDIPLANLCARFNAWYAFATTSVAFKKAEYAALDEVFEVNVAERIYALGKTFDGKTPAKDVLRGEILTTDEDMAVLFTQRIKLGQEIQTLEGLTKGLEIQVWSLRDEQIRRASARKLESHM